MNFLNEILRRRIPHILGSYIIAGSSLILFIYWLVSRYNFPEHYVTLIMFGILSIIPSVLILAYFHGAPGKDEWTRLEKIGIPVNVIFIAFILLIFDCFACFACCAYFTYYYFFYSFCLFCLFYLFTFFDCYAFSIVYYFHCFGAYIIVQYYWDYNIIANLQNHFIK